MQFDALDKSVMRLQITAFKNCNKWTVYKYINTTEDEKFVF